MTKIELTKLVAESIDSCSRSFRMLDDVKAYEKNSEKWSRAEHMQHLVLAVRPLVLAYGLPGFILRMMFGKSNRPSRQYEALKMKYEQKLKEGGKASAPFVPKSQKTESDKNLLIENFNSIHTKLLRRLDGWSEDSLDKYILPHPLLGKLTLREMIYFTNFHIRHHEKAIKN